MISNMRDNKAGMEFIDKDYINKIIKENTSRKFDIYQQKRTKRIDVQVAKNRKILAQIPEEQIKQAEKKIDEFIIPGIEMERLLNYFKVHIDMDAFFASVECRDNPMLRSVPMAVGSDSMLSTSNYLARKYGVRSAMPGFIAKRLCPHIIIVPGNYTKYTKESQAIRAIFARFDANFSMGSLDEAYLDITDAVSHRSSTVTCKRIRYTGECICKLPLLPFNEQLSNDAKKISEKCKKCEKERITVIDFVEFGTGVNEIVRQIRFEVEQATGLTCSAGIAANRMLAKIGSNINKPNGQFYLENEREKIVEFMRMLPIRKVPGIGQVSEAVLQAIDVNTCGDLFEKRAIINFLFTTHYSQWLLSISLGIFGNENDDNANEETNQKSISIERTFSPTKELNELLSIVQNLSEKLINSLQESGIIGGYAATLKIKFSTFDVITRCRSVDFIIRTVDTLFPLLESMLRKEIKERNLTIRLIGVRLSNLVFYENNECQSSCLIERNVQRSISGYVRSLKPAVSSVKHGFESNPILIELDSDDDVNDELDSSSSIKNKIEQEDILYNSLSEGKVIAVNSEHTDYINSDNDGLLEESFPKTIADDNYKIFKTTASAEFRQGPEVKPQQDEEYEVLFIGKIQNTQKKVHNRVLESRIRRKNGSLQKTKRRKCIKTDNCASNTRHQQALTITTKKINNNLKNLHNYFPIIL